MAMYKPGTLDDYAVMRRRNKRTQRQAENANAPTGSNVYSTTEKVQEATEREQGMLDLIEALELRLDEIEEACAAHVAPGSCAVTRGQPPELPGTWVMIGSFEAEYAQGNATAKRALSVYERIEDDGDD